MEPNPENFCGGNFQDWLEVNLLSACNGRCSWCIEKNGFHPETRVSWRVIVKRALETGRKNIILLGGEPTLYRDLKEVISALAAESRKVWVTTNGGLLTPGFVRERLAGASGVNISIHDDDLGRNQEITGVSVHGLGEVIAALHGIGAVVRLNCNCIAGHIDDEASIRRYVGFAKSVGADSVRFAELKSDKGSFVDLAKVLGYRYGLNDEPFTLGCHNEAVIDGLPVNFRQMCGLQTPCRRRPVEPKQFAKQVLYYDGKLYDGWQTSAPSPDGLSRDEMLKVLRDVAAGHVTAAEGAALILSER